VTTPPNPPEGNENPYGAQPYGQDPYGSQPQYGQPQYGTPYPGGPEATAPKTDGVSIAALVTGLLCCAPVNIILGIIGIRRTGDNKRKGRWMAVTGLVLGVLSVLVWVGLVVGGVWIFNNVVTPDNAEVGQCVDIDTDGDEVSMLKKDCTEDHDAEIVGVEEVDADNLEAIETGMADYCAEVVSEDDLATLFARDDIDLNAVIEDPSNVETGDHLVCYAEAKSGKLDEKILD
jgi:hypothetical protein